MRSLEALFLSRNTSFLRRFRLGALLGVAITLLGAPAFGGNHEPKNDWVSGPDAGEAVTAQIQAALSPDQALERLLAGNARFVSGNSLRRDLLAHVATTANGQHPFASIVTCIDSRVSPELVFDTGIGDVFVTRTAGNFVDPQTLGGLEFASKVAGAKLILVLGHTECGAIKGVCDGVELGNLTTTLAELEPAVQAVTGDYEPRDSSNAQFVDAVIHSNVRLTVEEIRTQSAVLSELEDEGKVRIVGGLYDVSTGRVTLLD